MQNRATELDHRLPEVATMRADITAYAPTSRLHYQRPSVTHRKPHYRIPHAQWKCSYSWHSQQWVAAGSSSIYASIGYASINYASIVSDVQQWVSAAPVAILITHGKGANSPACYFWIQ